MLAEYLKEAPIVPIVQAQTPKCAVQQADALATGGLRVIEVVLRTPEALECLEAVGKETADVVVGAGTVLDLAQAKESVARGAQFIVSPGVDEDVIAFCNDTGIDVFPGAITPTEVMRARNLGLRTVKFFPAGLAGGVPMLKAMNSVFREMQFMPTGGVSPTNLKEYLALPAVVACGGSWLTPAAKISAGDYGAITTLANEARLIARDIRG